MLLLVAIGQYHNYTMTPIWDMWNGEVEFFLKARSGDLLSWFGQHNEHRIPLARALFWADLDWFGGRAVFLFVANFLLVAAAAFVLWLALGDLVGPSRDVQATRSERTVFGLLVTAWVFQWTQSENLIWGFQNQFILVQLLPLCGFYCLFKATAEPKDDRSFILACVFGFASVGSMANGVFALPAMTLYALITRQGTMRTATLGALAAIGLALFLHNYYRPDGAAPPWVIILQHPGRVAYFTLLYLGNPFFALFRNNAHAHMIAVVFSLGLIVGCAERAISVLRSSKRDTLQLALLGYLAFLGGSALLTATGRVSLGLEQALASRYATPSIMAWSVFAILNAQRVLAFSRRYPWGAFAALAVGGAVLMDYQLQALQPHDDGQLDSKVSALALELGVADHRQIGNVFPNDYVFGIAENARKAKVSVFGAYPYRDDREGLRTKIEPHASIACQGAMTDAAVILGEDRFVAVKGWIVTTDGRIPERIRILDDGGHIVGYGLSGGTGPMADGRSTGRTGYRGYMINDQMGEPVTMVGDRPDCTQATKAAGFKRLFETRDAAPTSDASTASASRIQADNQWVGADFYHSTFPGMRVFGSYIGGDKDTGALRIVVKPGDRIFYRSGPTGGRQFLTLMGPKPRVTALPSSDKWVELDFTAKTLPPGEATLEFADKGDAWGEWSAIAVRSAGP